MKSIDTWYVKFVVYILKSIEVLLRLLLRLKENEIEVPLSVVPVKTKLVVKPEFTPFFDSINFENSREWKNIIIHHSATKDDGLKLEWKSIKYYHTQIKGWLDIGYHFGVERVDNDYKYLIGRPLSLSGAHTRGKNGNSIGICVVGNFDFYSPNKQQYIMAAELCKYLMNKYDIPISNVFPHRQFSSKSCPGIKFDMQELKNYIRG